MRDCPNKTLLILHRLKHNGQKDRMVGRYMDTRLNKRTTCSRLKKARSSTDENCLDVNPVYKQTTKDAVSVDTPARACARKPNPKK